MKEPIRIKDSWTIKGFKLQYSEQLSLFQANELKVALMRDCKWSRQLFSMKMNGERWLKLISHGNSKSKKVTINEVEVVRNQFAKYNINL